MFSQLPSLLLALLLAIPAGLAQDNKTAPAVDREKMWWAPTAEDWKKPCLITFQRNFEDALAVSKETGKAILICVNMDGEIASEHYTGVRYRQPEIAKLFEPYVCVIASVYRHTPRDYDEQGNRILCPRFGSVTCGEHIAIEPALFEKYFEGNRVAPRHIGIELDSKEIYDVYYAWDTETIFKTLRKGIENRPTPEPIQRGDRTIFERVTSRDIEDRIAVEQAYQQGNTEMRRNLISAVMANPKAAQSELLRLALRGFDAELAKLARRALAQTQSETSVDVLVEALRAPMETQERDALLAALNRLGETSPRAKLAADIQQGLRTRSKSVPVDGWTQALADSPAREGALAYQESLIDQNEQRVNANPADAAAWLDLAESGLTMALEKQDSIARHPIPGARNFPTLLFEDAERAAKEAEKHGASGWRLNATLAVTTFFLGDLEQAHARAQVAMKDTPREVQSRVSKIVLTLFAQAKQKAIRKAIREKVYWPAEWLADVEAAYTVIEQHPFGTDGDFAAHVDFLRWLGGHAQANEVLQKGLARYFDSASLHERLRNRILEEKGPVALEASYVELLKKNPDQAVLHWFAGYASFIAAETHRRAGRIGESRESYRSSISYYENAAKEDSNLQTDSSHYSALAFAALARLAYEEGDDEKALAKLLVCFERSADSASSPDGLNISPVDTAKMLLSRLKASARTELISKLETALAKLDPEHLLLPAYERNLPERK